MNSNTLILPTCSLVRLASPVNAPSRSPGRSLSFLPPMMHSVTMGACNGPPGAASSAARSNHATGPFWYASISLTHFFSFGAHRLRASPRALPRPVRPTRCTWTSVSFETSTLMTASRLWMSSPRAATSVATSTEQLPFANSTRISSRSRCSSSPYSARALNPCAQSSSASSRQWILVLQNASADAGR